MYMWLISHSLLVWHLILESWQNTYRPLVTSLCPRPQRLFEDFNKVTHYPVSDWVCLDYPFPLHYIINIHLLISILLFMTFFFTLLLLNCHFPHCLWLVICLFWQTNKQGEKWRSSPWMCEYGKRKHSHNRLSYVALDDLSLEFILETSECYL